MSQNGMLDAIIPALVQVDNKHRGIILNVNQRLGTDDAPFWHARFAKVLREKPPQEEEKVYKRLKPVVPLVEIFDPESYRTDKSIWFSPEFDENILSIAKPFQPTGDLQVPSGFDLVEKANDTEVRSEFPKDHVFGTDEFLWRAKKMTEMQPNGALGQLISNSYANIFYVVGKGGGVFAVYVYWYGAARQWDFYCYRIDDFRWFEGSRAFSRN